MRIRLFFLFLFDCIDLCFVSHSVILYFKPHANTDTKKKKKREQAGTCKKRWKRLTQLLAGAIERYNSHLEQGSEGRG